MYQKTLKKRFWLEKNKNEYKVIKIQAMAIKVIITIKKILDTLHHDSKKDVMMTS